MSTCLELAGKTATFLGEALPNFFGVMVFDLTKEDMPVVLQYRANQSHFGSIRKYLRMVITSKRINELGRLTCRGDVLLMEHIHKVSFQFFGEQDNPPEAALVLVQNIHTFFALQDALDSLLAFDTTDIEDVSATVADLDEPLSLEIIDSMVEEFTSEPERLTPREKTELMIDLYDTGVFELKGAVAHAALVLNMSEQSVYRYLAKIRRARGK